MIMTRATPSHPAAAPRVVMAKALGEQPYAGLVHEASLN